MRVAQILTITVLSAALAFPRSKDKVQLPEPAPLPDRVLQARTVFLTSDAEKFVYDEAYKQIHAWGRSQLAADPEQADLVWTVRTEYLPARGSGPPYRPFVILIMFDPKTKLELWGERQLQRFAFKQRNREKEGVLAVDAMFQHLRERIPAK